MLLLPQVPLTNDSACQGGVLVFAGTDGRLLPFTRRVGKRPLHYGGYTRLRACSLKLIRVFARRQRWLQLQLRACCPSSSTNASALLRVRSAEQFYFDALALALRGARV